MFYIFYYFLKTGKDAGFKLRMQIDQAKFRDWMSSLPCNLIEGISPYLEALDTNT